MFKKIILIASVFYSISNTPAFSQSIRFERNSLSQRTYDRLHILRLDDSIYTSSQHNLDRKTAANYFQSILNSELTISQKEDVLHCLADNMEYNIEQPIEKSKDSISTSIFRTIDDINSFENDGSEYTLQDFERKPILKYFYKDKANFYTVKTPSFQLYLNPVFNLGFTHQPNYDEYVYQNTRGVEIRAYIDSKLYVYARFLENQRHFTDFVTARINKFQAIPGQGSFKGFNSTVTDKLAGYDYFNTVAYLGFKPIKSIDIEFGHDNHFIGDGYRSLLLSNYASNYLYLKLDWNIWKFRYQNIFAEISPISIVQAQDDSVLPRKYSATHYLSFLPNSRFEIGIFESVIFARLDHFEFQYLNPVIFYRSVEHSLNSTDNVLIGLNMRWNALKGISIYGQFLMDEFKLSEVKKASGWWANKFGYQAGLKYVDAFGIENFDIQIESNAVRPYTYTHYQPLSENSIYSIASYSNYNQPLAHILGASFDEKIIILRHRLTKKIRVEARGLLAVYGEDKDGKDYGNNILLNYNNRISDYGNYIAQGIKNTVKDIGLTLSYEFRHNYFLDVYGNYRLLTREDVTTKHHSIGFRFRANLEAQEYDY